MSRAKGKFWQVRPLTIGTHLPGDYIKQLKETPDRSAIKHSLEVLEKIRITREWPNTKYMRHDGVGFYQLTVGKHRIYLHIDTEQGVNRAIICYACKKKRQKAEKKDLDRVVTNIQTYKNNRRG